MTVLAGAKNYFNNTYLVKRAEMLSRMRAAQIFDPLYAKDKPVTDADVDALSAFRFYKKPVLVPEFARMKVELSTYNELAKKIPDRESRNDAKGKDNFDIRNWWAKVKAQLPAWARVLRALLAHSPNSCPPERLFSILNDTFDDDQKTTYADMIEYSLQNQYNSRTRP